MEDLYGKNLNDALRILRSNIPHITDRLGLELKKDIATWANIVDSKLLARLSPDSPLMVTICGGGSSGKSTLFNSLLDKHFSPVGGSAGMNRRVLVSGHAELFGQTNILSALFEPFGCLPEPLKAKQDLTIP